MGRPRGVGLRLQGTASWLVREGEEDQRHVLGEDGKKTVKEG